MKNLDGFEQIGLKVNKSTAFGNVGGYQFITNYIAQSKQYSIITTVKKEEETGELQAYLDGLDKTHISYASYSNKVLMIQLKNDKELTVWIIDKILKDVASFLQTEGYMQCCRHCGEVVPVEVCRVQGQADLICGSCFNQFASSMPENKPANLPLGIVGALLGSLIGVVIWVVIYKLGFVAGITGFLMSLCCLKGYEILGGRLDKKGIFISIAIAIVMLFVAEMISLGLEIHSAFSSIYAISIMDAMQSIPAFLEEGEIMGAVIQDLLLGYGFMAFASFALIRNKYAEASTANVIEKLY